MNKPATVAVTAIAAGAAAIALGAWSGTPSQLLARVVQAKIEAASDGRVKIGSRLDLQLWPTPGAVIRDVVVAGRGDAQDLEIKVERVHVALAWSQLLAGSAHVTEVELTRPQARIPLVRERKTASGQEWPDMPEIGLVVDRVTVEDGSIALVDEKTGAEHRVDHIEATIEQPTSPSGFALKAQSSVAERILSLDVRGTGGRDSRTDGVLPVEFRLEAEDAPTVTGAADVRFGDALLAVEASRIDVGPNRFSGQVSVDFGARKPFVSAVLDAPNLDLAAFDPAPRKAGRKTSRRSPWSDEDLALDGLNDLDGEVKLTATRAVYKGFGVPNLIVTGKLRRGVAILGLGPTTIGDGQVDGKLTIDAAGSAPVLRLQASAAEVDLEPVVRNLADFRGFSGRASTRMDLGAQGQTPKALVATLSGSASGRLHGADIGGQDFARTVGSLAARLMTGRDPQEIGGFKINELSGSMRFDRGQGSTEDFLLDASLVRMTGKGRIDLPRQSMAFEFKPTLSLGKAQTGLAGSIDIGVPFDVDGPWTAPSVRPGNGLPTISSADFGLLPQTGEADAGPRAQPNDIINDIGSLVSDLITSGAKASPNGLGKAAEP